MYICDVLFRTTSTRSKAQHQHSQWKSTAHPVKGASGKATQRYWGGVGGYQAEFCTEPRVSVIQNYKRAAQTQSETAEQ